MRKKTLPFLRKRLRLMLRSTWRSTQTLRAETREKGQRDRTMKRSERIAGIIESTKQRLSENLSFANPLCPLRCPRFPLVDAECHNMVLTRLPSVAFVRGRVVVGRSSALRRRHTRIAHHTQIFVVVVGNDGEKQQRCHQKSPKQKIGRSFHDRKCIGKDRQKLVQAGCKVH